jgi:voltage-gated potassium channel
MKKIKRRIYEILDGSVHDTASRFCEIFIAFVVVANVLAIILESVHTLHEEYVNYFHIFDLVSVMIFSAEYVLRVWTYSEKYSQEEGGAWRGRKEYIFSFYGFIDFFGTMPFYAQLLFPGLDLRVLRIFRLMRIFKLSRYNHALQDLLEAIKAEKDSFTSALFLVLISCLLCSSLIYIAEGHVQPEVFPSIPATMKWYLLTIISGWGNVDPLTIFGTVLVIITQVLAIALAAILTGVVATAYTTQVERREAIYETEIREALADGIITEEESAQLEKLKAKFGMTDEQVEAIAQQVRAEHEAAAKKQAKPRAPRKPRTKPKENDLLENIASPSSNEKEIKEPKSEKKSTTKSKSTTKTAKPKKQKKNDKD